MSTKKDTIIDIMNHLIPEICPEEQEIFELYSDAFYEQAISTEKSNKMGDDCYFGEVGEVVSQFLMTTLVTVIVEEVYKGTGRYSWKKIRDKYKENEKPGTAAQQEDVAKRSETLKKVLEQKAQEETDAEKNTASSSSPNSNDDKAA